MLNGWNFDVETERGWLYVRLSRSLHEHGDDTRLVDALMSLAAERGNYRLIVEFGDGQIFTSLVAGQLVLLHKRIHLKGGTLRLCRLSDFNRDVLRLMGVLDRFQIFSDRHAAANT